MLRAGQVPGSWFGEMPDVLAMLRSGYAPDNGEGGDGGGSGDGQGSGGQGGAGGDGQRGSDGQPFDADRAQRTIQQLRDEIKGLKTLKSERDDLAQRLQAIEDKDKSDGEKAVSALRTTEAKLKAAELEAESLKTRHRDALIGFAIEREAGKANAIDAETVAALIDRSEIEVGDDGSVKGADKAVAALLKAKPFLVKSEGGSNGNVRGVGGTPGSAGNPSRDELIKQHTEQQQKTGLFARM